MALIDVITAVHNAINWSDIEHDWEKLAAGLVLNKYGLANVESEMSYFVGLNTIDSRNNAACIRMVADMRGLSSTTLDNTTKTLLDNVPFFSSKQLPKNLTIYGNEVFSPYRFAFMNLYRLAKQWNYALNKWNSTLAWQALKDFLVSRGNVGFLGWNPDTGYVYGLDRFYDENAQMIDWFLGLYEVDKTNNLDGFIYARDSLWARINTAHWSVDHYNYTPTNPNYECEGAFFPMIAARLRFLNGYSLPYWDNVLTDIKSRFLNNGWDSPQWCYGTTRYYAVVHKNNENSQRRLPNTIGAWNMLHAFYPALDETSKANIVNLLDGTTPAWSLLNSYSGLFDSATNKYRWTNDVTVSDAASAAALLFLFMAGIIPDTGSLCIPVYEWKYETWFIYDDDFLFDLANRKVRLPIAKGTLKFKYGTSEVSYDFESNGVYEIVFASDWNSIVSVTKIRDLDPNKIYVAPPIEVITLDATEITPTSAKLNGYISVPCIARGFEWGTQSGNYTNEWYEEGSFPAGSFSHTITGLTPNTRYYFRAKAKCA